MKIIIKVLQGQQCTLEVPNTTTVLSVKQMISGALKIPVNQQKLLLTGRLLSDDKQLCDYPNICDGVRLNLIVSKQQNSTSSTGSESNPSAGAATGNIGLPYSSSASSLSSLLMGTTYNCLNGTPNSDAGNSESTVGTADNIGLPNSSSASLSSPLLDATYNFLNKYYSDIDSKKIADEFMKEFNNNVSSLSLDDIERIATLYLHDESDMIS